MFRVTDEEQLQLIDWGRTAYNAYGAITEHRNYKGDPMPTWDELTALARVAWIAAASAVVKKVREEK